MKARLLTLLAVLAVLATGCSGSDPAASAPTAPPPTIAADPSPPPPPAVGSCYLLSREQLAEPTNDSDPVSCASEHTSQTILVGELDLLVDGHLLAVDSAQAQAQITAQCPQAFVSHVGGNAERRALSRLQVVWFSPTLQQADAGATWFRCDVIAFGVGNEVATLTKQVPRNALKNASGLERYGLCGSSAPGSADFTRVLCSRQHAWRAVSTIDLDDSKDNTGAYPGAGKVSTQGDKQCKEDARAAQEFALKFEYGWEWPTQEQWQQGQHYGICWAPVK